MRWNTGLWKNKLLFSRGKVVLFPDAQNGMPVDDRALLSMNSLHFSRG